MQCGSWQGARGKEPRWARDGAVGGTLPRAAPGFDPAAGCDRARAPRGRPSASNISSALRPAALWTPHEMLGTLATARRACAPAPSRRGAGRRAEAASRGRHARAHAARAGAVTRGRPHAVRDEAARAMRDGGPRV